MGSLIHNSYYRPRVFNARGTGSDCEIDRVQSIDITGTPNREKIEEVGRDGIVGYLEQIPDISVRISQLEYGELEFFQALTNGALTDASVTQNSFKTPFSDISIYQLDDDGTFKGTLWLPRLRVAGFGWNISDPKSKIERSFDLVGEDWITFQGANKYLIHKSATVASGEVTSAGGYDITLSDPSPVADPDDTDDYVLRVVRVRSGTSTELVHDTDYTDNASTLSITSAQIGDTYKYVYSAGSYISGSSYFVDNDSNDEGTLADQVTLEITDGNTAYRCQSASIDIRFDREDVFEIGNKNVVQRGLRDTTVTVTLDKFPEDFDYQAFIRGQGSTYGKLDLRKHTDEFEFDMKVYTDNDKGTFAFGFKSTDMRVTEIRNNAAVSGYSSIGITLEGKTFTLSETEGDI